MSRRGFLGAAFLAWGLGPAWLAASGPADTATQSRQMQAIAFVQNFPSRNRCNAACLGDKKCGSKDYPALTVAQYITCMEEELKATRGLRVFDRDWASMEVDAQGRTFHVLYTHSEWPDPKSSPVQAPPASWEADPTAGTLRAANQYALFILDEHAKWPKDKDKLFRLKGKRRFLGLF